MYTCQYCAEIFDKKDLTLDHVIPKSKKGPSNWENVVTACKACNLKKANKPGTPIMMGVPGLFAFLRLQALHAVTTFSQLEGPFLDFGMT